MRGDEGVLRSDSAIQKYRLICTCCKIGYVVSARSCRSTIARLKKPKYEPAVTLVAQNPAAAAATTMNRAHIPVSKVACLMPQRFRRRSHLPARSEHVHLSRPWLGRGLFKKKNVCLRRAATQFRILGKQGFARESGLRAEGSVRYPKRQPRSSYCVLVELCDKISCRLRLQVRSSKVRRISYSLKKARFG